MAGKVGQLRATIGGQSADEAAQLVYSQYIWSPFESSMAFRKAYRASGNIGELSVGQAGGNEGNQSVGELHLVDYNDNSFERGLYNSVPETTVDDNE